MNEMNDTAAGNVAIEDDEVVDAAPPAPPPRNRRKRLFVMGGGVVLLALLAVGLWLSPLAAMLAGGGTAEAAPADTSDHYVDAPALVVNLRGADGTPHFLRLRFTLVAPTADAAKRVEDHMPLVIDAQQSFLRGLRPEDLGSSAAVYRVKEEMMLRTRQVLGATSVTDILIQDMTEQ